MKRTGLFALFASLLAVGWSAATFWPTDADAARVGGGDSVGSRGSRSFSTPRQAVPSAPGAGTGQMRQGTPAPAQAAPAKPTTASAPATAPAPVPHAPPAMPAPSGMSSGLLSGLGGFALGGLLGAALFGGGHGAAGTAGAVGGAAPVAGGVGGSGIGLLEIILIGGLIWFAIRWFRQQKEKESLPAGMYDGSAREAVGESMLGKTAFDRMPGTVAGVGDDEVAQGLANIASMDPAFDPNRFLEGAKMAFQHIQGAWSDWSVDRLRPLLTERMWTLIQTQAMGRKAEGKRDIVEKIHFEHVEITEAWQENGDDWITVHFLVNMVDYTTDVQGKVLEGDPNVSSTVEEYWTFTRPVGSRDPAWFLSAIQQPGEVAKSAV
ncbi:MAG: Tim44 domain-containing protein [Magnetococcus sp. DMHC-8]